LLGNATKKNAPEQAPTKGAPPRQGVPTARQGESMETQTPTTSSPSNPQIDANGEFAAGTTIIYAMHGKCSVLGIETRQIGAEQIRFYKLEVQKSALSRSTRQEPAIWVPVAKAKDRGVRLPMSREEIDAALKILASREYYFQLNEPWSAIQPKLEAAIRIEGGIGLAKVMSYLHVLKRKQIVPSSEVVRLYESVSKLLLRELSEALREPIRTIEDRIAKSMKQKLLPDT
jgi:RNA polymerase-interacting CarD/CdnL/TRCF family regulator